MPRLVSRHLDSIDNFARNSLISRAPAIMQVIGHPLQFPGARSAPGRALAVMLLNEEHVRYLLAVQTVEVVVVDVRVA